MKSCNLLKKQVEDAVSGYIESIYPCYFYDKKTEVSSLKDGKSPEYILYGMEDSDVYENSLLDISGNDYIVKHVNVYSYIIRFQKSDRYIFLN